MTTKDNYYLQLACKFAAVSKYPRWKHGAVVVKHGTVLAVATNSYRNSPKCAPHSECSTHAEVAAMRKARWPMNAKVYVARVNALGQRRNSRPCHACAELLLACNARIFFTEG